MSIVYRFLLAVLYIPSSQLIGEGLKRLLGIVKGQISAFLKEIRIFFPLWINYHFGK